MGISSVEEARDEDVAGALVGGAAGGDEGEEAVVGFSEAPGVAERVEDAADVEGVRLKAAAAEVVQEAEGGIGVAVDGA